MHAASVKGLLHTCHVMFDAINIKHFLKLLLSSHLHSYISHNIHYLFEIPFRKRNTNTFGCNTYFVSNNKELVPFYGKLKLNNKHFKINRDNK